MAIGSSSGVIGREGGRTCAELITALLRRLGKSTTDGDNRVTASEAMREAVNSFNLERVDGWMDRLITGTAAQLALTASIATVALPGRYRKHFGRAWLIDTDGDRSLELEMLTPSQFLRGITDETASDSVPQIATVFNRLDTGVLEMWPPPSASSITDYPSIEMPCFLDIAWCGDESASMGVSAAIEQCIFAEGLSVCNDMLGDEDKTAIYAARAANMLRKAIAFDNSMRINSSNLRGLL